MIYIVYLDLESTFSYVTPFVVVYFGFIPGYILDPFFCFHLGRRFCGSRRVYRGCVVSVGGRKTLVDLTKLDIVDLDVILEIDWLHFMLFFFIFLDS